MQGSAAEQEWRKAQRCGTDTCVEVAKLADEVAVRDSTLPDGPVLRFPRPDWVGFVADLRSEPAGRGQPIKKRPWYKRRRVVDALIIGILVAIAGACASAFFGVAADLARQWLGMD